MLCRKERANPVAHDFFWFSVLSESVSLKKEVTSKRQLRKAENDLSAYGRPVEKIMEWRGLCLFSLLPPTVVQTRFQLFFNLSLHTYALAPLRSETGK
jgi:hypothetical protein